MKKNNIDTMTVEKVCRTDVKSSNHCHLRSDKISLSSTSTSLALSSSKLKGKERTVTRLTIQFTQMGDITSWVIKKVHVLLRTIHVSIVM